jgi:hypothetical protein
MLILHIGTTGVEPRGVGITESAPPACSVGCTSQFPRSPGNAATSRLWKVALLGQFDGALGVADVVRLLPRVSFPRYINRGNATEFVNSWPLAGVLWGAS